jgi:hypothetical protein
MTNKIGSKVYSRYRGCSNGTLVSYDSIKDMCQVILTNVKKTIHYISGSQFKNQYAFSRPRSKREY